ncbi:MAG: calcium/sodium antiporter [Phycisphaerales bacterium]|nr:calcium/sodium antiporter [Phycisphaerales bacterium]
MTQIISAAYLLVGLVVLIVGADALVRGAAQLAKHLGLSPFAIGVIVVAFGTSAPELFASIGAAVQGETELAIGNVVGSNIANIGLILGIGGMLIAIPVQSKVRKVEIPIMVALTIVTMVLLTDVVISRFEGGLLLAFLVAYVLYIIKAHSEDIEHELDETVGEIKPIWVDLIYVIAGIAGLGLGARVLVLGATDLAQSIGISAAIIGTTIVAFGTSVPELAATARAAMTKQSDMAVGSIVGSNVFNLLSVLGVTAIIKPLSMDHTMDWHLYVMLGIALLLMLWVIVRPVIRRGFALILLVVYVGYVIVSYAVNPAGS